MPLAIHLTIHVLASLLIGYIVWKIWKRPVASFLSALIGGVLIDLDHLIDYFLAYSWRFDAGEFFAGSQFAVSNKIYIFFHGWEYVFVLAVLVFIFKNKTIKTILSALALSMFIHLIIDVVMNGLSVSTYSVIYRILNNFILINL